MVSAVVVHFRGRDRIRRCVRSCLDDPGVVEVIVVDNEGTGSNLKRELAGLRVRLIRMNRNVGYGRAANVGLEVRSSDTVLVLNQDAVLSSGAVQTMMAAGLEADAWLVGPSLLREDGHPALSKERFPPPLSWRPPRGGGQGWRYVPWVAGAAMLFMPGHTDLRFDERLFMYVEDEELCWRIWSAGGRVVVADEARVVHEGGGAAMRRWGRGRITLRTVANRGRMVRWHRGWRALPSFARDVATRAIAKRLRGTGA
jgi:N-acetylglucosaminyl-diphospho-decaprenol L-rhamnosyltransferase